MSAFSWLSTADGVFRVCEIVAIIAGLLTVGALIGKDVAGRIVADRKAKEMLALQREVAVAQRGLARAIGDLDRRQAEYDEAQPNARIIKLQCIVDTLGRIPNVSAHKSVPIRVLYEEDARHADESFARKIWLALSIADWRVAEPAAESLSKPDIQPTDLVKFSKFGSTGLALSPRASTPVVVGSTEDALIQALRTCGARFTVTDALSPDTILLIVGPVGPPPIQLVK